MNLDFYANLKLSESFEAARERQNQTPLPAGWSLIVSDVKGSTKAIESGHYKYVNIIGAASIVTALNALKGVNSDGSTISVPFVFGGDGATLAVPNQFVSSVGAALLGLKRLAESEFGLKLSLRSQQLAGEVAIKAYSLSGLTRATLPLQTKLLNFLGTLLMNLKISTPQTCLLYTSPSPRD